MSWNTSNRYGNETAKRPAVSSGFGIGIRGPLMWRALEGLSRYIATPRVAEHRLFVWLDSRVCPDCQLIVVARDDDTTFGILHSRFHEAWSLRLGTSLEDRPRYTPTTTF